LSAARFVTIERRDLGSMAADQLRTEILSGGYVPGDELPSERELAIAFGVNRTTLRDAIQYLEAQGLIERRQGARCRVLDWRHTGSVDLLAHLLDAESVGTVADVIGKYWELIAELVVQSDADLTSVTAAARDLDRSVETGDPDSVVTALEAFHREFVDASGSIVIQLVANTMIRLFETEVDPNRTLARLLALEVLRTGDLPRRVDSLVEALSAGDIETARAAIATVVDDMRKTFTGPRHDTRGRRP
jgi:GntR family transcriptional repressor for pyruvate dehydrogenase complex